MKPIFKLLFVVALCMLVVMSSFAAGYGTRWYFNHDSPTAAEAADFGLFWEAWHILKRDFYGKVPEQHQMVYGAVRGVLSLLDDPHTVLVEPQPRQLEKDNLKGSFGGIGAYIRRNEAGQVAIKVMEDSPAKRAGLKDNDVLLKIDGKDVTAQMSEQDIVLLIRGPIGSVVKVTISRPDVSEPIEVPVTREKIETPTVAWKVLDNNIGYISLNLFGERTSKELNGALNELKNKEVKGLVLDLRNNPGGLLDAAVDVAGQFIGPKVVLHERKKDGSEKTYTASTSAVGPDVPIAILANKNTASASEIVAGAMKDVMKVPIIGEKTFGKGSVQLVYDLSDGSSLHVTVAHWFTPDDRQINQQGLSPDQEVTITPEDQAQGKDPQLDKALEYLRQKTSS